MIPGKGHLPSFFIPSPGHLDILCGGINPFFKENANTWGIARGGGGDVHGWN